MLKIYCISSCRHLTRGGLPAWGLGDGLTTPYLKNPACYDMLHRALELVGFFRITWNNNIIRVIKSRRMTRVGHVACMGEMRSA
jgi:hypothetical protein